MRLSLLFAASLLCPFAAAQDLAVSKVGSNNDYRYYGQSGGIAAYSVATTSCNVGSLPVLWDNSIDQAPAIATNMFRIHDGRIVQLGYSWLKDGFCAVNENSCGTCQVTNCDTLGLGCADTYSAGLNDGASGVSKFQLNPTTGAWPSGSWQGPVGPLPLRGRLQVPVAELMDSASTYVSESLYISEDDHMAGNARNNASWQEFRFNAIDSLTNLGPVQMFNPAIYAWKNQYPDVHIDEVVNVGEGGTNVHGYYFVGSKATSLGGGTWRYDYAIYNMNSAQGVGSFSFDVNVAARGIDFRDVDHHSGSPWSGADWSYSNAGQTHGWSAPTTYAQDPDGNALRWGTLYTFSMTTQTAPQSSLGQAVLDLYAPGTGSQLLADVILPTSDGGGNMAPVVDAGPDMVAGIGLPVQLDADVSDDGLPTADLTYLWERVSGPGGVNFAFNFQEDTPATFYVAGTYVLRLTVSDGQLQTSDELTFTATLPTTPPIIDAGPDQSTLMNTFVPLNGNFLFGTPWTVDLLWEQVSGPGAVQFTLNQSAATEARFFVEGVYTLRLTGTSGNLTNSDEVLVNVSDMGLTCSAGPDLVGSVGAPLTLAGSTGSGGSAPIDVTWNKITGPGGVNFFLQQQEVTDALFYIPGTYVIRLTATQRGLSAYDDIVVEIQ